MSTFHPGFHSDEHRQHFLEIAKRTRFGAAEAQTCGAKARNGGICRDRPLSGQRRCLKHAGPAGAKRHYEAMFEVFARGEIGLDEWQRRQHRRALNRLPRLWAKDPWTPGATIDLGEREPAFRVDLARAGIDVDALSPATVDRARWRWRRLRLDRNRPDEWVAFLTSDLPARVSHDGSRPVETPAGAAIEALFMVDAAPAPTSKRRRLDRPRPPARAKPRAKPLAACGADVGLDDVALAALLLEHGAMLRRIAGPWAEHAATIRRLAGLLHRVLVAPEDTEAGHAWRGAVAEMKSLSES